MRDSEIIEAQLINLGLQKAKTWLDTDLLILNSCSVRQASDDKVLGLGKKIKKLKAKTCLPARQGERLKTIVTGCLVGSASGERKRFKFKELQKKLSWVDILLPQEELVVKLPELLRKWEKENNVVTKTVSSLNVRQTKPALINISTGCDNFCTYCVVPYARGAEISRSKSEILKEVRDLVNHGVTEILLLGQNVNSWDLSKEKKFQIRTGSTQKLPFTSLLREIHEFPQIKKISFLSSNPFDFTQDLIDTLAFPKIDRYLHLPVQSGDDEILKRMNRRHTVADYLKLIQKIRTKVPEIEIGTDLIVGFPGETEKQFENTVKLCEQVKFRVAFVSMYSVREGTAAAKLKDDVSKVEKRRRHQKLVEIIEKEGNSSTKK